MEQLLKFEYEKYIYTNASEIEFGIYYYLIDKIVTLSNNYSNPEAKKIFNDNLYRFASHLDTLQNYEENFSKEYYSVLIEHHNTSIQYSNTTRLNIILDYEIAPYDHHDGQLDHHDNQLENPDTDIMDLIATEYLEILAILQNDIVV